jgi:hypothetical protein
MAQRRFHYDAAFERYLRDGAIPYIAVDEARRSLENVQPPRSLKSFDFVVYSATGRNLLIDVKGRKHSGRSNRALDNWVTQADVDSMTRWEAIFGDGFEGAFAFLYWCQAQPPAALFQDLFQSGDRWYALLGITLADYRQHMRRRSQSWQTVCMPADQFMERARPLKEML